MLVDKSSGAYGWITTDADVESTTSTGIGTPTPTPTGIGTPTPTPTGTGTPTPTPTGTATQTPPPVIITPGNGTNQGKRGILQPAIFRDGVEDYYT